MKKKNVIFSAVLLALGALIALAPISFAKVCPVGEKVMKCFWTGRVELFLGIGIALISLLRFFVRSNDFAFAADAVTAINAAGVILFPTAIIGLCGNHAMQCNAVTKPTLIVFGTLTLVAVALDFVLRILSKKSNKKS